MKGKIAEIFDSLQGEGLYLGERQIFVRMFGCNLECGYCDTHLDCFMDYEPRELLEEIKLYPGHFHSVSFTGGEPLAQPEFLREVAILTKNSGFANYLETNGTMPQSLEQVINFMDIIGMDIKLPSSTGLKSFWDEHKTFLKIASEKEVFIKTIICASTTEEDILQAAKLIKDVSISTILVLQPNSFEHGSEALTNKLEHFKNICRKESVTACVIPQMHKIIGIK
jgi:7-carboxy-7-deazaguanine synthase